MLNKVLLGSLVVSSVGAYYFYAPQKTYSIQKTKLPPHDVIAIQHVGTYKKIQDTFDIVKHDFDEFKSTGQKLSDFNLVGIYYDDPRKVPDETRHRAIIGAIFDPSSKEAAKNFLQNRPQYKSVHLPELEVVGAQTNFSSSIGLMWVFHKIHSEIRDYAQKNNLVKDAAAAPLLDFYKMKGGSLTGVDSYIAYGPGSEKLEIHNLPQGPQK